MAQSKAEKTQPSAQKSVPAGSGVSSNVHPPLSDSSLPPKQPEEEKLRRKGSRRSRKGSKGARGDKEVNEAIRVVKALRVLVNKARQQQDIFALRRQHIDEVVQPRFDGSPIAPKNLSSQFNSASCISPPPSTLSEDSIEERKSSGVIRRRFSESDISAAMDTNPLFTPVRSAQRVNPQIFSSSANREEYVTSRRMSDGGIQTAMNTNLLFTPVRPGATSSTISGNANSNSGDGAAMRTNPLLTPARPTAVPANVGSDDSLAVKM